MIGFLYSPPLQDFLWYLQKKYKKLSCIKKLNAYVTHRSLQTKYLNENTKLKYRILEIGPYSLIKSKYFCFLKSERSGQHVIDVNTVIYVWTLTSPFQQPYSKPLPWSVQSTTSSNVEVIDVVWPLYIDPSLNTQRERERPRTVLQQAPTLFRTLIIIIVSHKSPCIKSKYFASEFRGISFGDRSPRTRNDTKTEQRGCF